MSTFLDAVNRVLRINTIISGDDDDIATFNDTQHRASLNLAKIAIQSELNDLISDRIIPYEETDGNITYATNTRTYSLPADFIRFKGKNPFLLELDGSDNSANVFVTKANEDAIRRNILDYREQTGNPIHFYLLNGTTNKIGLFPVPDSTKNGVKTRFPYEKDVSVSNSTDTMPFRTTSQFHVFCDMAARRFQFILTKQPMEGLKEDIVHNTSKTALMSLMSGTVPNNRYGYDYE